MHMKEMLPYLKGATLIGATAFMFWFAWWKSQLYKELVEPHILLIRKDLERANARIAKLEHRADSFTTTIDERIYEVKKEISEIKEILANLNGKFEMFLKGELK